MSRSEWVSGKGVAMALLASVGSILFMVENWIPSLPWMRLGLANLVTLLALRWWGTREAFAVLLLRVCIGGLLSGRFFTPLFFMGLGGGLTSTVAMACAVRCPGLFSVIGVSILGAVTKNAAQLAIALLFYVHQSVPAALLPYFFITSLIAGLIVGILTRIVERRVARNVPGNR